MGDGQSRGDSWLGKSRIPAVYLSTELGGGQNHGFLRFVLYSFFFLLLLGD